MRYGQISREAIESERHTADVLAMVVDTSCRIAGLHHLFFRFGSTSEVGVFSMTSQGMIDVPNPSELFLSSRYVYT